jgi:Domain of unknown function (DUF1918)
VHRTDVGEAELPIWLPDDDTDQVRFTMALRPGARVAVERESTDRPGRSGVIEEVLHDDPSPRYRIRWDDGHESIYTPAAGALREVQSEPEDTTA